MGTVTLLLPPDVSHAIAGHADAGRPSEVCGFLLGASGPDRVEIAQAVAATNAWQPVEERARRYAFDPREQVAAERTARQQGLDVVGYYHSHPTAAPVPSQTDLDLAWPAYTYLIVGFPDGGGAKFAAWTLDKAGRAFIEQRILPAT